MNHIHFFTYIFSIIVSCSAIYAGEKTVAPETEFPSYSTDMYIYTKTTEQYSAASAYYMLGDVKNGVYQDITYQHFFNDGINRKKITVQSNGSTTLVITETWTTRNPSYMTKNNALLLLGSAICIAAGVHTIQIAYEYKNPYDQKINNSYQQQAKEQKVNKSYQQQAEEQRNAWRDFGAKTPGNFVHFVYGFGEGMYHSIAEIFSNK